MKKLLAITLLVIPTVSFAGMFYGGNKLNQWAEAHERVTEKRAGPEDYADAAYFHGYVIATSDALDGIVFCIPETAVAGQLTAVTRKYLREHPERWSEPATRLVVSAFTTAFPCAKKR